MEGEWGSWRWWEEGRTTLEKTYHRMKTCDVNVTQQQQQQQSGSSIGKTRVIRSARAAHRREVDAASTLFMFDRSRIQRKSNDDSTQCARDGLGSQRWRNTLAGDGPRSACGRWCPAFRWRGWGNV
jgi:hypothetical protein